MAADMGVRLARPSEADVDGDGQIKYARGERRWLPRGRAWVWSCANRSACLCVCRAGNAGLGFAGVLSAAWSIYATQLVRGPNRPSPRAGLHRRRWLTVFWWRVRACGRACGGWVGVRACSGALAGSPGAPKCHFLVHAGHGLTGFMHARAVGVGGGCTVSYHRGVR